jgi:uncharacterized membrane protein
MKKFQVSITFKMDDEFMSFIPAHRSYINELIEKGTIDHYAVTMESQRAWITISAESKEEADKLLSKSPIYKYWTSYVIEELLVLDGQHYRLPSLQLN